MISDKPTILFTHSSDELYGADLIMLQLVEGLVTNNFRPIVILPTDLNYEGLLSNALQDRGIETIKLNTAVLRRKYFSPLGIIKYFGRLIKSTLSIIRIIRRESVDIVHTNTSAVLPGALAAYFTGTPHIWHVHEIIVRPRFLWRATSWLLPRLSASVVAVSGPTRDHLCQGDSLNKEKSIVIHNGIHTKQFDGISNSGSQVREELGIHNEQILIGTIGRISYMKGQDYFLNVIERLIPDYPESRYLLVGGTLPGQEKLKSELLALADDLNVSNNIIISDFRNDIPQVLDALDIFVLPSNTPDPFPTVILEAMAAQKPVVANAHGGSIEMVDNMVTGILVEPGHPAEMANAIKRLIEDPQMRQNMGRNGKERLDEKFSLQQFYYHWLRLYKDLIPT